MGQSPSIPELTRRRSLRSSSFTTRLSRKPSSMSSISPLDPPHIPAASESHAPPTQPEIPNPESNNHNQFDLTGEIPDECLALIFQSLPSPDRKRCSLVCKRWLIVEGQSRHRLSLNAQLEILPLLPTIFTRFDSVTKLALRCDRRSISIGDDALVLISLKCRSLTRLKLRGCRELTDVGVAAFAQNCKSLKKLSCGSCVFGSKGLNAVLHHCVLLEEISIKRLRGINNGNPNSNGNNNVNVDENVGVDSDELIGPGLAAKSLKSICLKELYNGQMFGPLIVGSKNLRTLKLIRCLGEWDRVLETMASSNDGLVELHLERIHVTDFGLSAMSSCARLEILHLVKTPECTNLGVVSVAERCKLLRKVHIDGWRTNRIGDEGLSALGRSCGKLQELVLIGINATKLSLEVIAVNCRGLERLALCSSETIGDEEMVCITTKCLALKKFCIKSCPISDSGLEGLAWGCPNLVKIKVKKCREVTRDAVEWLRGKRETLILNLDADEIECVDASASEAGGVQEDGLEYPPTDVDVTPAQASGRTNGQASLFRSKFSFLFRRNVAACALRRWSTATGSSNSSNGNQ